ncbi:MAG: GWxTD domain-containing protein [Clostridiales bacterium]|nr:GWxTD domain-containing protein [Clostridiales bacterium]
MKKKEVLLILVVFFLFLHLTLAPALLPQKKKSPKDLPPQYRKWLEEEVVYIITPKERDVFLQLETDREREAFINAFWKQRDPESLTPENEFKVEHYRRIAYANQHFGKEGPGAGWRSAMGRIYILLGAPDQVEKFENDSEMYPVVLWFYREKSSSAFPIHFTWPFLRGRESENMSSTPPVKDGPQSLIIHYRGDPADYLSAYNKLYNINPTVAQVSMSLLPGEGGTLTSPSLASEILVRNKIPRAPYEKVEDAYAEKLLAYKDIIEVDYTANYIPCEAYAQVVKDSNGMNFVHYLIEPKKLSLAQVGERFRANLEVNGKVTDLSGRTVYQFERTVPIDFDPSQLEKIKDKLFSFQDIFPLLEGNYKLDVLLKNTISKEFSSMEVSLTVPETGGPRMSPLVLSNRIIRNSEYRGRVKPFLVGDIQLVPSPRNDFTHQDTLYLFFQVSGLTEELRAAGSLEFTIFKEGEKVFTLSKSLRDYPDPSNILEEFSLTQFPWAYYKIQVSLLDPARKEILFEEKDFLISHLSQLSRPWVFSLPQPPPTAPIHANTLGVQCFQKNDLTRAMTLLEKAYRQEPGSKKSAIDYAQALFAAREYARVKEVLTPHLAGPDRPDFLLLFAQSCQALGELREAIALYKEYLSHFGANINALNAIGECYYQLGNFLEALVAWEKSLELSPKQEKIRERVDSLRRKK